MPNDTDKYNIKAVSRCFQILDFAAEQSGPISIQDVCTALETNSNMAFRLLASLQSSGYMTKDPYTGLYAISLKTLKLSRSALHSQEIRKVTMPYLELLWNQFPKANVNMAVFYNGEVLMLDRIDTQSTPRTYFTPGRQLPFHCTAVGKVLTSEMDEKKNSTCSSSRKALQNILSRPSPTPLHTRKSWPRFEAKAAPVTVMSSSTETIAPQFQ